PQRATRSSPDGAHRAEDALIQVVAETSRLVLRELTDEDLAAIQVYATDPAVVEFLPWGPNTDDDTRRFLSDVITARAVRPRQQLDLGIALRTQPRRRGCCRRPATGAS